MRRWPRRPGWSFYTKRTRIEGGGTGKIFVNGTAEPKTTLDKYGFFSPDTRHPTDDLNGYSEQQIKAYRAQLEGSIEDGGSTTGDPGYLLFMWLGLITDRIMYKPLLTQSVEYLLIEIGGAWWKNCTERYDIVS